MNSPHSDASGPEDPSIQPLVVLTTMPGSKQANALAETLIGARVAGCVQVLPPMVSHYEWQGELRKDSECLVLIKTTAASWGNLLERLQAEHPYEVPQIIALGAAEWSVPYAAWLQGQVLAGGAPPGSQGRGDGTPGGGQGE